MGFFNVFFSDVEAFLGQGQMELGLSKLAK